MRHGKSWCSLVLLVGVIAGLTLGGGPVRADDVTDSINEALKYYNESNFVEVANSLDYAAQLIRQKQSANLQDYLPKALAGWTEETVTGQAVAPAMFGGMISAEKRYHRESSTVMVKLITESPIIQGLMMMFSNPMLATSDGGRLQKIANQKAIIKYRAEAKSGDINLVVAKRMLVTVEGTEVSEQDLIDYAAAVDYGKLSAL